MGGYLSEYESYLKLNLNLIDTYINKQKKEIQATSQSKSIFNQKKIDGKVKTMQKKIQAAEGNRDVLNTAILDLTSTKKVVDTNNYKTYSNQVISAYDMYENRLDYGCEIFGATLDTRVACIMGEGINYSSENKAKLEFIKSFIEKNKLNGSKLLSLGKTGELEGKDALILNPVKIMEPRKEIGDNRPQPEILNKEKSFIKLSELLWIKSSYEIVTDENDRDVIVSIKYKQNKDREDWKTIDYKNAVYVKLGGTGRDINETTGKMHKALTNCENASRASFDLRKNSHLFGKIKPTFTLPYQMQSGDMKKEALSIENQMNTRDYDIGDGYAGPGLFEFKAPPGHGADLIIKDIIQNMRYIATITGIPIHWLSYPELMSNRATAENISRMMEYSTKNERLVWEESLKELIEKAMRIAVDEGIASAGILKGDFTIKLPLIDMQRIIDVIDKLYALVDAELIPPSYIVNMLPGSDSEQFRKEIEEYRALKRKNEKEDIGNQINKDIDEMMNNSDIDNQEKISDE